MVAALLYSMLQQRWALIVGKECTTEMYFTDE